MIPYSDRIINFGEIAAIGFVQKLPVFINLTLFSIKQKWKVSISPSWTVLSAVLVYPCPFLRCVNAICIHFHWPRRCVKLLLSRFVAQVSPKNASCGVCTLNILPGERGWIPAQVYSGAAASSWARPICICTYEGNAWWLLSTSWVCCRSSKVDLAVQGSKGSGIRVREAMLCLSWEEFGLLNCSSASHACNCAQYVAAVLFMWLWHH